MKNHEFIEKNTGVMVYITGEGDLAMNNHLRYLIGNKTPLYIVKLTKGGMAYLTDGKKSFFTVPPKNVREYSELLLKESDEKSNRTNEESNRT